MHICMSKCTPNLVYVENIAKLGVFSMEKDEK